MKRLVIIAIFVVCLMSMATGCSVPNLEGPECTASRSIAKEFYSFHFGNEMKFSADGLKAREKFLTPELIAAVAVTNEGSDVFTTGSADIPKAFRIGGCEIASPDTARVEIVLFWRDDTRSEERRIHVETKRLDGRWLINRILN
jgi:hypothetical protein